MPHKMSFEWTALLAGDSSAQICELHNPGSHSNKGGTGPSRIPDMRSRLSTLFYFCRRNVTSIDWMRHLPLTRFWLAMRRCNITSPCRQFGAWSWRQNNCLTRWSSEVPATCMLARYRKPKKNEMFNFHLIIPPNYLFCHYFSILHTFFLVTF